MESSDYGLTPFGVALQPWLNSPCTKFSQQGTYSVKLKIDAEKAAPLVREIDAKLQEAFEAAKAKAAAPEKVRLADPPYQIEDDGAYVFSFRVKARGVGKDGKPYRNHVPIWTDRGQRKRIRIGQGSEIRLSYKYETFNSGLVGVCVCLRPLGVQVLKAVSPDAVPDAAFFGFDPLQPEAFGAGAAQ